MIQIFVRTLDSKTIVLDVEPSTTVMSVKELICYGHTSAAGCSISPQSVQRIPPVSQRLNFGGKQLQDDRTLSSYGISGLSTLNLVMRLVSGVLIFIYDDRYLNFRLNSCTINSVHALKLETKKHTGFSPLIFYRKKHIDSFVKNGQIPWRELFGESMRSIVLEIRKPESAAPVVIQNSGLESLLTQLNMYEYYDAFIKHKVAMTDLPNLDEGDLKELVPEIGPRSRLRSYIRKRKRNEDNENPCKRMREQ